MCMIIAHRRVDSETSGIKVLFKTEIHNHPETELNRRKPTAGEKFGGN